MHPFPSAPAIVHFAYPSCVQIQRTVFEVYAACSPACIVVLSFPFPSFLFLSLPRCPVCTLWKVHELGEVDTRGCYTALSVACLTNVLTPQLSRRTAEWLALCQTHEGGIGTTRHAAPPSSLLFALLVVVPFYLTCCLVSLPPP